MVVGLQEAGERGQYADLQWLFYYMERSDAMIHSVIQRRRAALLSLDWPGLTPGPKLRGVESPGMLLAASLGDELGLVTIDGDIGPGAAVK